MAPPGPPRFHRLDLLALAGLTLLAAALRLWHLAALPPGMHIDEAYNILDARAVLAGARPVFLPANAGRDVLYTYLQAPLLATFGDPLWSARLASALVGTLTVPATWWAARRLLWAADLAPGRIRAIALLSAALVALSYWHLHFSRYGIRAVLFPLVVVGVVGVWVRVVSFASRPPPPAPSPETAGRGDQSSAGAGAAQGKVREVLFLALLLGVACYTHPAGRGLVAIPLLDALYRWLRWRETWPLKALAVAAGGAVIVATPLLVFWWRHQYLATSHAGEVSILGQGAAALGLNALKVAGMFNLAGDPARWRNLPGRPVFDILTGLAFLLGLAITLGAARRGAGWAALALIWLGVLLVPTLVTDAAPNFSRAIGVLPVACVLAAIGMERVAWFAGAHAPSPALLRSATPPPQAGEGTVKHPGGMPESQAAPEMAGDRTSPRYSPLPHSGGGVAERSKAGEGVIALALLLAWLIVVGTRTGYDYFVRWAGHPETGLAFDADKRGLGEYYRDRTAAGAFVYVSPAMAEHPTVQVAAGRPPSSFDPRAGWALPLDGRTPAEFATLFSEFGVQATLDRSFFHEIDPGALPDRLRVFKIAVHIADSQGPSAGPWSFEPYFRLADIDFPPEVRAGGTVPLRLEWDVLAPTAVPLHTAVQLQGLDGAGLGQGDGPPLDGSYPTNRWRPGERIVTTHVLHVKPDAPPGPAELRIGWYAPPEGGRPFEPLVLDDRGTTVRVVGRTEVVH